MRIFTDNTRYIFNTLKSLTYLYLLVFSVSQVYAEGTKQINLTSAYITSLNINRAGGLGKPFASWDCPDEYRLKVNICNANEKIYLGFQAPLRNTYFRLKNPSGVVVLGPLLISAALPAGYIANYNQAVAGPQQLGIAGGYNALIYDPAGVTGDYSIEFNRGSSTVFMDSEFDIDLFDVTVANGPAASNIKLGRLWSRDWQLNTHEYANRFMSTMYVYANDGIVTNINFNGMQPYKFHVSCNSKGTINTGNFASDRMSVIGNQTFPEYKIFLNDPDNACYPTGTFGNISGPIVVSGCAPNYCININIIDKAGPLGIILDLNGTPGYQNNSTDVSISFNAQLGNNCVPWDGRDGKGNLVAAGTNINIQVDFFNGLTNLPLYDVEENNDGFIVSLVRPSGPAPSLFWDDTQITSGTAIDGIQNLTGCTPVGTNGCHKFRNRGINTGPGSPPESINTWWYANIQRRTIKFDAIAVDIDANADSSGKGAGNAKTVCGDGSPIALNGSKIGPDGSKWTSNGTGTFSNINTLNPTYTPSTADLANGNVTLTIKTSGASCPVASDFMQITLQPVPKVNAGGTINVCENSPNAQLAGSVTNGVTAIKWTGGAGSYAPNNTTLTAVYTPNAAEITAGSVTLTLTSTAGNGVCSAAAGSVTINIAKAPIVDAGTNTNLCANNPVVNLTGSIDNVNGTTNPKWTGGAGNFADANSVNTTYTPTTGEISAGSVTLSLTADKPNCTSVTKNVIITFKPAPTVDAGPGQTLCENNSLATLAGTSSSAAVSWVGGAGTFTPDRATKTAKYQATASEISTGSVSLTLQTVPSGGCSSVASSPMVIKFTPKPTVDAGADLNTCSNKPATTLQGAITGATGAVWTGFGGTFGPSNTALNAIYTATTAEIGDGTGGFTFLVLTTTGNGKCVPVSDTMNIIFDPNPIADAGPDVKICKNKLAVQLDGETTNNQTQTWTTSGTGTFDNVNLTEAIYTASQADTVGNVTLTLKANRPGCIEVSDPMVVSFLNKPIVRAGADVSVCDNNPVAQLNGFSSTGTGTWTGGTGAFTATTYTATAAEATAGTPITLTYTSAGNGTCNAVADQMVISFYKAPIVDAGSDQNVCSNNININLQGKSSTGAAGWKGGNGTFTPDSTSLNVSYIPTNTEVNAGTVTLTLTSKNNIGCKPVSDGVKINFTPQPTITLTNTLNSCANKASVSLNATITNAGGGIWSNGGGVFSNGLASLTNTYTPSASEIQKGKAVIKLTTTSNGTCNPVTDSVIITIAPAPIVDAGADQVVCGDVTTVNLAGKVTNATGGLWSKVTPATGTFANANAVNTTYSPSAADIDSGYVKLNFVSTGTGTCNAVNDTIRIFFTAVPTINAGPDQTVCTNALPVQLNAFGSPGAWTGGAGIFSSSSSSLNATYSPTTAEISAGTLSLTFTTTASATCSSKKDQVIITIKPAPVVNAGGQTSACSNSTGIPLNGTVTNATGGKWATMGTGTFTPDITTLNGQYIPSANDINNENLKLTLTSTGNGFCPAVSDTLVINLQAAPIVNAGPDQSYCANNATIQLNGVMQSISGLGGIWSGGAGTFTPNKNEPNAKYTPTANEIASGSLTLTYSSISNGICTVKSDDVKFTFTPAPTTNTGTDKVVCENAVPVSLTAVNTLATTGSWKSFGTAGSFAPSNVGNTTAFYPSATDITNGSVDVVFTTSDNANCLAVMDTVHIDFTSLPIVDAGKDTTICKSVTSLQLYGNTMQAIGSTWTSSGTGIFDDNTSATAIYTPTVADKNAGSITLTLTGKGAGTCGDMSDKMVIKFKAIPVATAGSNRDVCADLNAVSIVGKITYAGGGTWTTSGSGTFENADSLQTNYLPSTADKTSGLVTLTLTSNQNGVCTASVSTFTLKIDPIPTLNIGADRTICADSNGIDLSAAITNAGTVKWASAGTGSYSPNANSATPLYIPSVTDRANGKVKIWATTGGSGSCGSVADTLDLTINPAPIVNAGTNISICKDHTSIPLSGSVTNAGGGVWTTSGTGSFSPDSTSLSNSYLPSMADKATGNVILTLKSTGNNLCKVTGSQITITFTPTPVVNAGADKTLCSNIESINLNGSVKFGNKVGTGKWSSTGGGSILPNSTSSNPMYYPTEAEVLNGNATLIYTSDNNGTCSAVSDTVQYLFQKTPLITAGANTAICADQSTAAISATATHAKNYAWSTLGTGSFSPSNLVLNTNYVPTASDISSGKVDLVITTLNNGVCPASTDTMTITITPKPTITVGPDVTVCSNLENIILVAKPKNAEGVQWSTSGSGSFSPNNTADSIAYFFSPVDISVGSIVLTAVTTGNGLCKAVYADQVIVAFAPAPVVNAGPDITTCINNGAIQLNGTITNSTDGGTWTTNGSGTFSNANALNTTYTPSASDEISGNQTTITLVSNSTTNCQSLSDNFTITYNNAPVINAGPDSTYCTNSLPIVLQGSGASGAWTGGAGTFTPDAATLNATYMPTTNEINNGTLTLTVSTNPGLCVVTSDNVTFKFKNGPTVDAGTDDAICANTPGGLALKGASNSNSVIWSTANGEGTFVPDATSLNANFIPSASQISNQNVTLILTTVNSFGCPAATDQVVANITPAPVVNAGFDVTTCMDVTSLPLKGTKSSVASGVQWTTSSGKGSFSPQTASTTFTPDNSDKTAGKVSVYITTTGSGLCAEVQDTVDITFTPTPTVLAGNDTIICSSNAVFIKLKGAVTIANGGVWTSTGSGIFSPDNTALKAEYFPTAAELNAGSVALTLTSTGNGECQPKSDQITFTIQTPDTVNAGADMVMCADNAAIPLLGKSGTNNVKWTTNGTGTFTPDNQLATNFQPSAADKIKGGITLTLQTTNASSCAPDADFLTIQFNPTPVLIVNSGFDKVVCISDSATQLNGFIANAKGGKWTTAGDGTFSPSDTVLNAFYVFGPTDKTGPTLITLTSTGNGPCSPVSDNMKITYQAIPDVKVNQKTIPACADVDSIHVSATVTTATSGIWSTSGTGYFAPKADSLASIYFPSKSDAGLGTIWLTIQSVNNGECGIDKDTVFVNFGPSPTIDAGPDRNICRNATSIALKATTTIATGGTWITSGAGSINPNTLVTNYAIAAGDSVNEVITMTVTSSGQGTCKPVSDNVSYTLDNLPVVNAGPDVTVCETSKGISLAGTAKNTNVFSWISTGSGTFVPDNTTLSAVYIPSADDTQGSSVTLTLVSEKTNECTPVSDQMTINFEKMPTISLITDPACYTTNGINISATVTNTTGGTWYTTGKGNFSPSNTALTGKYYFGLSDISPDPLTVFFVSNPTVCPADTASQVLFVNLPPSANAGKDENVCQGNNVTLSTNATANFQYQWTEVGGGVVGAASFITVNIPADKSYQLQVTDQNSCTGVDTVKVFAEKPVTFGLAASICLDPYFLINALPSAYNANGSFQWYKDGNLMQGKQDTSIYASEAGKYVITYNIGQCTSKDSTQVHALPIMVNKGKVACIGAVAPIRTTNIPGGAYTWQAPITQVNSYMNNVNPVTADTNFYYVTGKDVNSCQTTDSIRVIGVEKPILTLTDVNLCTGDTITLNATPTNINKYNGFIVAYNWQKNKVDQNKNASTYFVNTNGQYIAKVSIADCQASDTANVKFNTYPTVSLSDTTIYCKISSSSIVLDAGFGTTNLADTLGTTYQWTNSINSTVLTTRKITVSQRGQYTVQITNKDNCKVVDSSEVIGIDKPIINLADANLCIGDTITLDAAPSNASAFAEFPITYKWFKDNTDQNKNTPKYFINTTGKYIANVFIKGCIAADTANVVLNVLPVVQLGDTLKFCPTKKEIVTLDGGSAGIAGTKYLWTVTNLAGQPSTQTYTTQKITIDARSNVTVLVTDTNNCKANDAVFVKDVCAPQIFVPNAFTPGKPGKDQKFQVYGMYFKNFKITVYSRWGEVLFSSTSKEVSWDGDYIDQEMQYGVYPYIITYDSEDPQYPGGKIEGSVTLLR